MYFKFDEKKMTIKLQLIFVCLGVLSV